MSERACDICRLKPAVRLLVRAELGGQDTRQLVCETCKPIDGEWSSMAMDGDGLAKEYEKGSR